MRQYLNYDITLDAEDFASIEAAYAYVRDSIDLAGHNVQINVPTVSRIVTLVGEPTGYGQIILRGKNGHPGQTSMCFYIADGARVTLDNMTLLSSGDGVAVSRGIVLLKEVWIGQCLVGAHACGSQSLIRVDWDGHVTTLHNTNSKIQFNAENGANIELAGRLTISGGPVWENYAQADGGSIVDFTGSEIVKAAEKGNAAAWYDMGFVRLGPGQTWDTLPGNGKTDSDR